LSNAYSQREQSQENTHYTKNDDAPESVVVKRISFISPKLADPLWCLRIHIKDQLTDTLLEDAEFCIRPGRSLI
jgi:hypothetical protein